MDATAVSARWSVEMDRLVVPGTRMRWLDPVRTPDAAALAPSANRAVAVGSGPASTVPRGRTALFADEELAQFVSYAEDPEDAAALAAAALQDPDPVPFQRVFDLEGQLALIPHRKA
jgi:hypothetical protein